MVSGHLYQEGDGKAGDDVTPPRVCCYLFCPPHYHQHHACHQLIEIKIILVQLHILISPLPPILLLHHGTHLAEGNAGESRRARSSKRRSQT